MEQITARALRQAEWKPVYRYNDRPGFSFTTYASDRLPGLTITKEQRGIKRVRTTTIYKFGNRTTESPTQIVRFWNDYVKAGKASRKPGEPNGRPAASGAKPAGRPDPKEP